MIQSDLNELSDAYAVSSEAEIRFIGLRVSRETAMPSVFEKEDVS